MNTDIQVATQNPLLLNKPTFNSSQPQTHRKRLIYNPYSRGNLAKNVPRTKRKYNQRNTNNRFVSNNPVVGKKPKINAEKELMNVAAVEKKIDSMQIGEEAEEDRMNDSNEEPKAEDISGINVQMFKSKLNYNPFYKTKFSNNFKKPRQNTYNLNAADLLIKIKSDPSYLSTKTLNEYNMVKREHTQLTDEQLDNQDEIARDFI
jgi:hypothetical protein